MSVMFQNSSNLFLVLFSGNGRVHFGLSQISCEIYINRFTNAYDSSLKNASFHGDLCVPVNEKYIGAKKPPPPTLVFCKVLVIYKVYHTFNNRCSPNELRKPLTKKAISALEEVC